MAGRIVEKWECRACAPDYPCIVEIHATDDGLPDHLKGLGGRFRHKGICVCRERTPDWKEAGLGENPGKQNGHRA
jgi:hypothetical protein